MSKYGKVARLAAEEARNGLCPISAWKKSAKKVFPKQKESRKKACPRCAFLGLAEDGMLRDISPGNYTRSRDNKRYALKAVKLLHTSPYLSRSPEKMWECVMSSEGEEKTHNEQMSVVADLWNNGDIDRDSCTEMVMT